MIFRVLVPVKDFKTGNPLRDMALREILGQNVIYRFSVHSVILQKPSFQIQGKIQINKVSKHITFSVTRKNGSFHGFYQGKLTDLGIIPPKAGPMDLIASTLDFVQLRFHISENLVWEKIK